MASNNTLYEAILAINPDAYWVLDEPSGSPVQQGSSTASNLTLSGSYTHANGELIPGDTTKFLSLTGGKGSAARGNIVAPATTMSVTFLAKITSTPQLYATFFSMGASGETLATNYPIIYQYNTYPQVKFVWEYATGDNIDLISDVRLNTGLYSGGEFPAMHITFVKDAVTKTVTTYVNGICRETLTYTTETAGGTSSGFYLGGSGAAIPAETLQFDVGHVAVFQRVLTREEVVGLAKASGFMSEDFGANETEYGVLDQLAAEHVTLASTKSLLEYPANKLLTVALDPLIDPSLLQGSEAYATE